MRLAPRSATLALLCALLAVTAPALAQSTDPETDPDTKAAAEALFNEGRKLMEAGRFAEAAEKLEASNRFDPSVGTLLNLGVCREQSGQIALAWETFRAAAEEAGKTDDQRGSYATERMQSLAEKLFFVWIEVPAQPHASNMHVLLDDQPVPAGSWGRAIVVEAGSHTVQATAPGTRPFETRVEVSTPGQEARVEIPVLKLVTTEPEPVPAPVDGTTSPGNMPMQDTAPGPGMPLGRKLALGSGAVGVVGLVLGSIQGLRASSAYGEAEDLCPIDDFPNCTAMQREQSQDKRSDARGSATVATASFAVGIAAIAAGAALWYLTPAANPDTTTTRIEPLVSPTLAGLGLRTTF